MEPLSSQWCAALVGAGPVALDDAADLTLRAALEIPESGLRLVFAFGDGAVSVTEDGDADITLVMTERGARALAAGTTNAQRLLADDALRLRGSASMLRAHASDLAALPAAFGALASRGGAAERGS